MAKVQPKAKKPAGTKKATAGKVRSTPKAKQSSVPLAADLAAFMGVPQRAALKADQSRRLLKPFPGYRAVMDNVAAYLREDNDILELTYDPDEVMRRLAKAKDLSARNAVLEAVLAGSDAERQEEDGFLMKVLTDAVRRVNEQSGVHPELRTKWQEILDFVKKNRPGRTGATTPATPAPATT